MVTRFDPHSLEPSIGQAYAKNAHPLNAVEFLLNLIPGTFFGAFASGDLLQILFVASLTAAAIAVMGPKGDLLLRGIRNPQVHSVELTCVALAVALKLFHFLR